MTNQRAQTVRTSPPLPRRSGFTLAELLVVIGIIAVLMAILFPVINKVKAQGWRADSMNQISVLRSAIDAYQLTFNAYPGPLSNVQITSKTANSSALNGVSGGTSVTMSENLFLGIAGGVRIQSNTPAFVPSTVGQGPGSLNPRNPKVFAPFLDGALKQSSKGKFAEAEGGDTPVDDTNVPEFVDRFPQNPLPVLYYRARVGAAGPQQYSSLQNDVYVITPSRALGPIGPLPKKTFKEPNPPYNVVAITVEHGLHVDSEGSPSAPLKPFPITGQFATGDPRNRGNSLLPFIRDPSTPSSTYSPRGKDTYVLISAGSDRIYGTNDDLTSFGSVE